jgi:hypothetical protein
VQTPTTPHTDPFAAMVPGVNGLPLHAPKRDPNDSVRPLAEVPSSFCVSDIGVNAMPAVSWMRALVYQPCGVEALQSVVRYGTGVSLNVTVNAGALGVGAAVDEGESLFEHATASVLARAASSHVATGTCITGSVTAAA